VNTKTAANLLEIGLEKPKYQGRQMNLTCKEDCTIGTPRIECSVHGIETEQANAEESTTPGVLESLRVILPAIPREEASELEKPKVSHTPGPWSEEGGWIIGNNGKTVCDPRCMNSEDADDICEMDANARLIGAAPDLLEALKDIAEFGRSYGLTAENAVAGIRNKARDAIRKAVQ
jgi:hypothetical protein